MRRASKHRLPFVLSASLALLLAGCSGAQTDEGSTAVQSTQKIPVSVSTAQRGSLQAQVLASGVVTAASQTAVLPMVSGTVRSVDVEVGQQVHKGDRLFVVDAETATAQLQQAQAGLKAAEAQLTAAETQADVQLAQAQAGLKQAQATLQQAQAAEKAANHVSTGATQVPGTSPSGPVPASPPQGASSSGQAAPPAAPAGASALPLSPEQAKANLEAAQAGVEAAQQALDAAQEKAPVAAAQAGVEQAQAAVHAAQLQVDSATVEAPVEGTVTAVNVSVGSIASPQMPQPAVMIEQLNPLQVTLSLAENQIGNVSTKSVLTASIPAADVRAAKLHVVRMAPAGNPQLHTFTVKAQFDSVPKGVREGMTASVQLPGQRSKEGIVIPLDALFQQQGVYEVYVVDGNGTAHLRQVELIQQSEQQAVLASGVHAGEQVVTKGQNLLHDGAATEVVTHE